MDAMLARLAEGRTDLVFDLVRQGMDADAVDARGVSLLQWCAYFGDVSAIRFLLTHGAALDALGDNLDLNGAAFHGNWRLCQFLLENGANANHPLPDTGETPLHAALCKANRPAFDHVIRVLLAHQADPNAVTLPGVETGCFMRDCRTRAETPLHRAAAFGSASAIQWLLAAGASVDARDMNGDTPLSWASWHLRPGHVLNMLCHASHSINPSAATPLVDDHGLGWSRMDANLLGKPHV